jgi:NTE family protein
MDPESSDFHEQILQDTLREVFGDIEQEVIDRVRPRMTTVGLMGGQVLMRQGDPPDSIYLVLSGRLRAVASRAGGEQVVLGEIGRGEPIGEMGVVMQQPRGATIIALRDSVLLRLSAQDFTDLLQTWPRLGLPLARKLIERMTRSNERSGPSRDISNICLLPLHAGLDVAGLARRLRDALESELSRGETAHAGIRLPVALLDRAAAEAGLGPGGADITPGRADAYHRQLAWLDEQEARHAMQVLVADREDTPWTQLCIRHADHVLLVADADGEVAITPAERHLLAADAMDAAPAPSLVLLHPDDRRIPRDTRRWLEGRAHVPDGAFSHFHVRRGKAADWARLARILSGQATGLVLAGGGARGFAHLGVMQALQAQGVDWDLAGGTSIGAVMAALAAVDRPVEEVTEVAAKAFAVNPTGDLNWLPLVSVIAGRRLARVIREAVVEAVGAPIGIEDLWKPYFCVASNYSRARPEVLRQGDLAAAVTASVSIPAALPPVLRGGDLLVDGGTFNNYPVDVMRQSGAGRVIGVDLSRDRYRPLELEQMPTTGQMLFDRLFRPRSRRRYGRLPNIAATVFNVAAMSSQSHQRRMRDAVDLGFAPDISRVGMLEWRRFDEVVQIGLEHAQSVLSATDCPVHAPSWHVPPQSRRWR